MRKKEFWVWSAAFTIWIVGALILRRVWVYQRMLSDPIGSYIEFSIMFLATFYVFALFPLKRRVDRFFALIGFSVADNEGF